MTALELASRLRDVRREGSGFRARCPACNARTALAVEQACDRVLVHCFAECDVSAVLGSLGLGLKDLFSNGSAASHTLAHEREQLAPAEARRDSTRAGEMWESAKPADPEHPYLARKRILPHGIRQIDGRLVIPLFRQKEICGLQLIGADGEKRFLAGTQKKGARFALGSAGDAIVIAEGFATAATIFEATGLTAIVAFDCGNLLPVAESLREKFGDARLILAADFDRKENGSNPGLTHATAAARAVGGCLAVPQFADDEAGSDWNDFALAKGTDAVRSAFECAVNEEPLTREADEPQPQDSPAEEAAPGQDDAAPVVPPRLPRLPEIFWAERRELTHIRQAAHSRNRSADAVFFAVLARIAAFRPPCVAIDTGIASPASLNLLVAFVDPSGGGKSSPEKIARRLVPVPDEYGDADGLPLGSGEGLAEAYMGWVVQPRAEDPAKTEKVRSQLRYNVLFYADEGQVLSRLSERAGTTLGESLRRAFNGETLGQTNASQDRTRRVRDYSLGLIAGMQPAAALALLEEAALGTPQRFLWSSVIDPSIPDEQPDWPGELRLDLLKHYRPMTIDADICAELRRDDTARQRGETCRDPLDAHEPLCRLKVAGALAILADRPHVIRDDWRLAGVIWETSCAVRNAIATYGRAVVQARREEQTAQHVVRTVAADRAIRQEEADIDRVARVVARKCIRSTGLLSRRDFQHAIAGRDKQHLDRAITYAQRQGWVIDTDQGYARGPTAL